MNIWDNNELPPDWQALSRVFSALGDDIRQRIFFLFEPGEELSIKQVKEQFNLSRTNIVHHLTVMHEAGVLQKRHQGRETLYSVSYDIILEALTMLQLHAEQAVLDVARKTVAESDRKQKVQDLKDRAELMFITGDNENYQELDTKELDTLLGRVKSGSINRMSQLAGAVQPGIDFPEGYDPEDLFILPEEKEEPEKK